MFVLSCAPHSPCGAGSLSSLSLRQLPAPGVVPHRTSEVPDRLHRVTGVMRMCTAVAAIVVTAAIVLSTSIPAEAFNSESEHDLQDVLDAALVEAEQVPLDADAPALVGDDLVEFGKDSATATVSADVLELSNGVLEGFQLPKSVIAGGIVLADDAYVRMGQDVDLALQVDADDSSMRTQIVIKDRDAPQDFIYQLGLADGAEAVLNADGGVDITQVIEGGSGSFIAGGFDPPWAVDSAGKPVATRYEIRGNRLVQIVDHRNSDISYPVVADPFWIPIIIVALKAAVHVTVKVGSRTVRYAPVAASTVANALKTFTTLQLRAGAHTFKLDKAGIRHILTRHHPKYWDGSAKRAQTFLNPHMSISDVKALVHSALKQWPSTLKSKGTNSTFTLSGKVDGVKYTFTVQNGRVVQFYPRA